MSRALRGLRRASWVSPAVAVLALAGCAQPPKTLYQWGSFPRQQYDFLLHEGASVQAQITDMEAQADQARAAYTALPPGFRAHLGMLRLSVGDADGARQAWQAERTAFPESAAYIDFLLKRLDAPAAGGAPAPATKDNPA